MRVSFSTLRRRVLCLGLSVAALAVTGVVRADDVPTFSDPDVNAYVKAYGDFADHYSTDMKAYMAAVKSNDTTKMQEGAKTMQADATRASEMSTKSSTISGKVKQDEVQKFSAYLQKCSQKMADAAKPQ